MGAVVKVFCESCHAQWNCHTGCGMQHGMLENIVSLFPKDVADTLMKYAGCDESPAFDFAFRLAVCRYCNGIVSVPVLKMLESGTQYMGICPDCGNEVGLIKDLTKKHCPVCKRSVLKTLETGRWD